MKLYFLRHGPAGDRREWEGDDADRPLTREGKERIGREAETIARLQLDVDGILTSPLARAYQTAEIVAKRLALTDRLVKDDRLCPGFRAGELTKLLRAHPSTAAPLLVGHEPDMSAAISRLIGGGRLVCKKGALACVELPEPTELKGRLVWLIPPKLMAL